MARSEIEVPINAEEDVVIARSRGRDLAKEIGFGMVDQARIPTAISELARNILVHASHGVIRVRELDYETRRGIEVVAEDTGPGIENIDMALTEGFTTAGGLGLGLPGAKRLMDEMEIRTEIGVGTVVVVRKWLR